MQQRDAQTIAQELRERIGTRIHTTEHVRQVLQYIDKPGQRQDLKRQVITLLFPTKSMQGHSTADDLVNYQEY